VLARSAEHFAEPAPAKPLATFDTLDADDLPPDVPAYEPPRRPLAAYLSDMQRALDADDAAALLDEARSILAPDEHAQLVDAYRSKWNPEPETTEP
jgi:hypothetical protein